MGPGWRAVTVLTLTAGRRCGAVRCGRRRSSDQDDRRVGLSPGARNTTESARKEGERNPDWFLAFSGFGWTVRRADLWSSLRPSLVLLESWFLTSSSQALVRLGTYVASTRNSGDTD